MWTESVRREFRKIITDCLDRQGWEWPKTVTDYVTDLLVDRIDANPWQPEPSYAEQYMRLQTAAQARSLGDTAFFARAVFPSYMERRGLGADYFVQIGQGCYDRVLKEQDVTALRFMRRDFEYIAEMTWTAVHSQGELRRMWQD